MSRILLPTRRNKTARCRPSLERLESRLALSTTSSPGLISTISARAVSAFDTTRSAPLAPNLTVLSTTPADGAALTQPPSSVAVTFDRPIDPSTLSQGSDVVIEQLVNGSWQVMGAENSLSVESTDPTGTQLILTLPAALPNGQYQLVFSGNSLLAGLDGSMPASAGTDQLLAQFTIAPAPAPVVPPGTTIATAPDLGSPSTGLITVSGSLNLSSDPGAVQIYKVELPDGHEWRLGAEIDAQRIGSPLNSTLSLFDSQGNVLFTTSTGRVDDLADPFFFQGLAGGTYYIGVSGYGNVPGQAGGYDPVSGRKGAANASANGGAFLLKLAADTADVPTQLVSYTVDRADPLSATPTGVTMTFSGPLNMSTIAGKAASGIVLVNQDGQAFPIAAIAGSTGQSVFSFVWDQALPPGRYSVKLPSQGGLTDLAGRSPAVHGRPSGTLLSFNVSASRPSTDPNNLGPLYNLQNVPYERQDAITPTASLNYRFVVLWSGVFKIQAQSPATLPTVNLIGPDGTRTLINAGPGGTLQVPVSLTRGSYILQFVNPTAKTMPIAWTLRSNTDFDSLLMNGVGQGPALNLRLASPSDNTSTDAGSGLSGPAAAAGSIALAPSAGAALPTPSASHDVASSSGSTGSGSVSSTSLFLSVGGTLVGRPSTETSNGPAAGMSPGEGVAASGASGVTQGTGGGAASSAGQFVAGTQDPAIQTTAATPDEPMPVDGAVVVKLEPGERQRDRDVLASAELVTGLRNQAERWMVRISGKDVRVDAPEQEVDAEPIAIAGDLTPKSRHDEQVKHADVSLPIVIGASTVMAMQYYRPMRRWVAKKRGKSDAASSLASRNGFRGPHGRR